MSIEFAVLKKKGVESQESFKRADKMAEELRQYLEQEETQQQIREQHVLGASSARIQEIVLSKASALGFEQEKKGLYPNSTVRSLRPDYFFAMGDSGILLEVERGKTTTNNMDLLDFWKCHICERAKYLFLLVPKERRSAKGTVLRHFRQVNKRLGVFFDDEKNYVNVNAVYLFGY
jgi:hypothetical protein